MDENKLKNQLGSFLPTETEYEPFTDAQVRAIEEALDFFLFFYGRSMGEYRFRYWLWNIEKTEITCSEPDCIYNKDIND